MSLSVIGLVLNDLVAIALDGCYLLLQPSAVLPPPSQEFGSMAIDTFHCPGCQAMLRYSTDLEPGTEVRCPQSQQTFAAPERTASSSAAAPGADAGRESTTEPGAGPGPSPITDERSAPRD